MGDDVVDVDHVDVFVGDGREQSGDDGCFERGDVVVGDFAAVVDDHVAPLAGSELGGESAAHLGDLEVGSDGFERLGVDQRRVDGGLRGLAAQDFEGFSGDVDGDAFLGFLGGSAEVGRGEDSRVFDERIVVGGFLGEDVEGGAGESAVVERVEEG